MNRQIMKIKMKNSINNKKSNKKIENLKTKKEVIRVDNITKEDKII